MVADLSERGASVHVAPDLPIGTTGTLQADSIDAAVRSARGCVWASTWTTVCGTHYGDCRRRRRINRRHELRCIWRLRGGLDSIATVGTPCGDPWVVARHVTCRRFGLAPG